MADGGASERAVPAVPSVGASASLGAFQVSVTGANSAAIKADGTLWTWGYNEYGQIGDGTTADRHEPTKVMSGVAQVALGDDYTAALKTDGTLWTWGG